MKHTLQQVFHSGKFVVGFIIFTFILLTVIVYPLFVKAEPLEIIGQGTFFPPGIYANLYDSIGITPYTLMLGCRKQLPAAGRPGTPGYRIGSWHMESLKMRSILPIPKNSWING
jgi:hypothetical protein